MQQSGCRKAYRVGENLILLNMDTMKLSKNEMKKIFGGVDTGSTCSTTCSDGESITVTCTGGCVAADKQYVSCTDPNENNQKSCKDFKTAQIMS